MKRYVTVIWAVESKNQEEAELLVQDYLDENVNSPGNFVAGVTKDNVPEAPSITHVDNVIYLKR